MKLIIAGGRDLCVHAVEIEQILEERVHDWKNRITEIFSGCASGADQAGEYFARKHDIIVKKFPANWDKHGRAAGPIRNQEMAEYGDILLLIWDGKSRGSASMKREMTKQQKPILEKIRK